MNEERDDRERLLVVRLKRTLTELSQLAQEYRGEFYYTLSYIQLDSTRALIKRHRNVYTDLNTKLLNRIIDSLINHRDYLQWIEHNYVNSGNIAVVCIDDRAQPGNLRDKVEEGNMYLVKRLILNKRGQMLYQLDGMNLDRPSHGFNTRRFQVIFTQSRYS